MNCPAGSGRGVSGYRLGIWTAIIAAFCVLCGAIVQAQLSEEEKEERPKSSPSATVRKSPSPSPKPKSSPSPTSSPKKKKAKTTPSPSATPKKKKSPTPTPAAEESDDESSPTPKPKSTASSSPSKKKKAEDEDETPKPKTKTTPGARPKKSPVKDAEEADDEEKPTRKAKPTSTVSASPKPRKKVDEEEAEEEESPKPKAKATASPSPKKSPGAKKSPSPSKKKKKSSKAAGAKKSASPKRSPKKSPTPEEIATPTPPRATAVTPTPPRATAVTPTPAARAPAGQPFDQPAQLTIEKSGFEAEQTYEPPPPTPEPRRFLFWKLPSRAPVAHRYLTRSVRAEIDNARVLRRRWQFVVVHNSGSRQGNAKVFDYYHRRVRKMKNGMAYHFVIGNGTSTGNGQIEIGDRWRRQINGGHVHSDYLNNIAIGICLVGDFNRDQPTRAQMEATEELIKYLRQRCGKIDGRDMPVRPHKEMNPPRWSTDCPGDVFPYSWFRRF